MSNKPSTESELSAGKTELLEAGLRQSASKESGVIPRRYHPELHPVNYTKERA